jgi:hypothetical protein
LLNIDFNLTIVFYLQPVELWKELHLQNDHVVNQQV